MKFKVSKRDFIMFIVFCIFLLYLCAIGVLNFAKFSADGEFYGLNPFPAFTKQYFAATMTFFTMALIIIFTSVSSYIFDKEKGKGFGISIGEKEEKGYSRWSTKKEIIEDKDVELVSPLAETTTAAGIPLINDGEKIYVDNGEYHNLVIGSTGSGKSQTIVKPMVNLLAKHGESMIITDPKAELYKSSANSLKEKGYKIVILNFREPEKGNAWNPLILPYKLYKEGNVDKAVELLEDVAANILYDQGNKNDPFWEKSSADYFAGLALGLFEDADESKINLNSINYMSTVGEDRFANSNFIKEYFNMKGESSSPYIFASNTVNAPSETKGGILSVFRQKIRLFASREKLSEMLSYSDFDIRDIGKQKTAVFMVIHDEKTTYHPLATIFIKQCYESLVDTAQENGGKLKVRTNFILDEFANMPPLKDVDAMVTAARSRTMRFTFIIQNFAQLKDVYETKAETIKGNCGNLVYLISTELQALEEISKMCGEVKSKDKDKTASTPLVTVTDLQKLKLFEAIIIRLRKAPFKTKYEPDFKMNWGKTYEEADFPTRFIKPVEVFDIKTFVQEEKRKKLFENMEKNSNQPMPNMAYPNMPGMPSMMGSGMPNMHNGMGNGTMPNFMNPNPFGGMGSNPMANQNNGPIDVDSLMKKIDEQIAKLEEEERQEKLKQEQEKAQKNIGIKNKSEVLNEPKEIELPKQNIIENSVENKPIIEDVIEKPKIREANVEEKPKINIDADSIIVDENIVTDDQFFDDFFGDE